MAYNTSKGTRDLGDIQNENDKDTQIDFGSDQTLDLLTWNLEWFPKHDNTISYVSDFILALSPDIIALHTSLI